MPVVHINMIQGRTPEKKEAADEEGYGCDRRCPSDFKG